MTTHIIAYAYPPSSLAQQMRRGVAGCYVLTIDSKATAHDTYAQAVACAAALGTEPHRWSIDHPANVRVVGDGQNDIPF